MASVRAAFEQKRVIEPNIELIFVANDDRNGDNCRANAAQRFRGKVKVFIELFYRTLAFYSFYSIFLFSLQKLMIIFQFYFLN